MNVVEKIGELVDLLSQFIDFSLHPLTNIVVVFYEKPGCSHFIYCNSHLLNSLPHWFIKLPRLICIPQDLFDKMRICILVGKDRLSWDSISDLSYFLKNQYFKSLMNKSVYIPFSEAGIGRVNKREESLFEIIKHHDYFSFYSIKSLTIPDLLIITQISLI
jgi:hypothetical protein